MSGRVRKLRLAAGVATFALAAQFGVGALAAAASETVRVRYGEHERFVRIVFDVPDDRAYTLEPEPEGALLRFETTGAFDLSGLERAKRLNGSALDDGVVRLTYAKARSLKHYREGGQVIVDIYETAAGDRLPKGPRLPPRRPAPAAAAQPPSKPVPPAPDRAAPAAASTVATPASATAFAVTPPPEPAPMPPAREVPMRGPRPTATPAPTPASAGPPDLTEIAPAHLSRESAPRAKARPVDRARLYVSKAEDGVELRLGAAGDRAAAFSRAGAHWIVIDRPMRVDLRAAARAGLDIVQLPFPDQTALHVKARSPGDLSAWPTSSGWRFALGKKAAVGDEIVVRRRYTPHTRRRLELAGMTDARVLRIVDPEVGDALFVATVVDGRRVVAEHDTPDARLPPTAVGAVVEPKAERVGVAVAGDILSVRKRSGLRLSNPDHAPAANAAPQRSLLDPIRWRGGEASYRRGVRTRLSRIDGLAEFSRNPIRLDLAKFSLAHGFAAEAIGYLQAIARNDKGANERGEHRAMRGIARAMLGQHDWAAADLDDPLFNGDPQVEIWRAVGLAEAGAVGAAAVKFGQFWQANAAWPPRLRLRLAVVAGEAAVAAGLPGAAERFLQENLDPAGVLSHAEVAALGVVDGGLKAARGDANAAMDAYRLAYRDGAGAAKAKAELALVKLELANGAIEREAAAGRLSRLQMRWRGDRIEFDALRTLGELRLAMSDFREGFRALSMAARVYGDRYDTTAVHAAMTAGFERAFVDGGVEGLPPLEAVALFEDFEALAPPGAKGDRALATLARHLVALDLVEEADSLMDHLVRRRLDGAIRAEVGADLAKLRVALGQWREALSVVDQVADVAEKQAGADTQARLRRLRAASHAGLGDTAKALKILKKATDPASLQLRADIAWKAGDWVSARMAYRDLAKSGAFEDATLARGLEAAAVRWAVTATMLKHRSEVADVAKRYGGRIQDPALASALKALAAPTGVEGEALAAAREAIVQADAVTAAVDAYQAARGG